MLPQKTDRVFQLFSEAVDLLNSAFAIHHLSHDDKARFLRLCRRQLAPQGRIRSRWSVLTPEQQQQVIDHLSQFDFPADRDAIRRTAEACGWQWQWLWQGDHQAEALVLLTPARSMSIWSLLPVWEEPALRLV